MNVTRIQHRPTVDAGDLRAREEREVVVAGHVVSPTHPGGTSSAGCLPSASSRTCWM